MVQSTIANTRLDEFEKIYQIFDANGDGYLTEAEIINALEVLGRSICPSDRTQLFDRLVDGVVTRNSFIEWMEGRQDLDIAADLRQIFDLIDVDNNGWLSFDEFTQLVRCLKPNASDPEVEALVRQADVDNNGRIDFEEFIATQRQNSALQLTVAALRSFKKVLIQYAKVAEISSIALVEVDSDLGAGKRGASRGVDFLKDAAIQKQSARMRAENGIVSLDNRAVQNENHALAQGQNYPNAKYVDAIYKVLSRTTDIVANTLKEGFFPIVLAGDHSTAAGTIAGIKKAFPQGRLGVIWIDAHADIHSPYTTPSGNMHGMPLAVATGHDNHPQGINQLDEETSKLWELCKSLGVEGEANLGLQDIIYVAVRDTEPAEDYTISQFHIPVVSTDDVRQNGPEKVAQRCLDYLAETDIIYVTFDVDSMDSTICMGTGTPAPGGLWAEEALRINAALMKDPRVCCWEICEINPLLDTLNTMAENSLNIFEAVIDAIASRLDNTKAA